MDSVQRPCLPHLLSYRYRGHLPRWCVFSPVSLHRGIKYIGIPGEESDISCGAVRPGIWASTVCSHGAMASPNSHLLALTLLLGLSFGLGIRIPISPLVLHMSWIPALPVWETGNHTIHCRILFKGLDFVPKPWWGSWSKRAAQLTGRYYRPPDFNFYHFLEFLELVLLRD